MEFILLIIIIILVFKLKNKNKEVKSNKNNINTDKSHMNNEVNKKFTLPIPKDYRIYFHQMEVSGVHHYKSNAIEAFSYDDVHIIIQSELDNEYDKNALKVIIENSYNERFHIGYISKEIAKIISDQNILDFIIARLKYVKISSPNYFLVELDILGLKSEYSRL